MPILVKAVLVASSLLLLLVFDYAAIYFVPEMNL